MIVWQYNVSFTVALFKFAVRVLRDCLCRGIARARLETRVNESRRMINRTPREAQFFARSY